LYRVLSGELGFQVGHDRVVEHLGGIGTALGLSARGLCGHGLDGDQLGGQLVQAGVLNVEPFVGVQEAVGGLERGQAALRFLQLLTQRLALPFEHRGVLPGGL
jgi:hypothetical protein